MANIRLIHCRNVNPRLNLHIWRKSGKISLVGSANPISREAIFAGGKSTDDGGRKDSAEFTDFSLLLNLSYWGEAQSTHRDEQTEITSGMTTKLTVHESTDVRGIVATWLPKTPTSMFLWKGKVTETKIQKQTIKIRKTELEKS